MTTITPFLWFDTQAEEAARFYASVFPNSRVTDVVRYGESGPGPAGSVMTVRFQLDGSDFVALNGGPMYRFTEAVSFVVDCKSQEEVDYYWAALTDGGEEGQCGWLKDRYGLSWQVVPDVLPRLLDGADRGRAQRVLDALMGMTKLDIRALEAAAEAV